MPTIEGYNGAHTGTQIDSAISAVQQKQTSWDAKQDAIKMYPVTLLSTGWDSSAKTQTVTVPGILADETKQLIRAIAASDSQSAYDDAGVYPSAQAANSLTFTTEDVPSTNLTVYVVVTPLVQGGDAG